MEVRQDGRCWGVTAGAPLGSPARLRVRSEFRAGRMPGWVCFMLPRLSDFSRGGVVLAGILSELWDREIRVVQL